jgi:hypothetical protein
MTKGSKYVDQSRRCAKKVGAQIINSAALYALMVHAPQIALANGTSETNTIYTPVVGQQGPDMPPLNGGDTLIIAPSGQITIEATEPSNTPAVKGTGGKNTIKNSGAIITNENGGIGILLEGGHNEISNSGNIKTLGNGSASGIRAYGGWSSITNAGTIETKGAFGDGIITYQGSNQITNSGSIFTEWGAGIISAGGENHVLNSGTINVKEFSGIAAYGGQSKVQNTGLIYVSGADNAGIEATDGGNTITSSGSIITSGPRTNGISASGDSNEIINVGSIKTNGEDSYGIAYGNKLQWGNAAVVTNSGDISASGESAGGILAFVNTSTILNSGQISAVGNGAVGMVAAGNSNVIRNSGNITTNGMQAHGIYISGENNVITNTGTISASGEESVGIVVYGNYNTVTNSGSIISAESYAVYFGDSGNTLNISNNFLGGSVYMGAGGAVNMTTGANYSKLYTFEGTSLTINGSGPIPLFINQAKQQAATYDPTIFASSSDALADMTSAVSSLTPGRFNGTDKEHPIWARGFGTTSSYSGTYSGADTTLDRNYIFSGVALGYDAIRSKDLVVGLLGGYGQTSITADAESTQSFNNTSDGGFLGLYGQKRWKDWAFDFALYGGVQSFQQQRYVNDNLAYLGNSSTQASFQGWWIAPELAATVKLAEVNGWSLLPTARLRYAQQWMGGYTETGGGAANAAVSGRNVTIGQSFVGVGTRKTIKTKLGKNTKMVLDGQVGYMYRGAVGDDTVDVTMIGQSLSLPTEISSRNAVAVSAGVALDLSSAVTLKIRGDAAAGGGMNYVGGGWAGLSFKF